MAEQGKASSGKKSGGKKKHGRNRIACKAYRDSDRRGINKARKIIRTMRKQPGNKALLVALKRIDVISVRYATGKYFPGLDWTKVISGSLLDI